MIQKKGERQDEARTATRSSRHYAAARDRCWATVSAAETVSFNSGDKILHGLLYRPAGTGPFPTVLYNHGSAPGLLNNQAFDLIGPLFTARGWAFFAPYRRGQGLSSDAGRYIMDEVEAARARGGERSVRRRWFAS